MPLIGTRASTFTTRAIRGLSSLFLLHIGPRLVDCARLEPLIVPEALAASGLMPAGFAEADSFAVPRSYFERLDSEAPGSDFLTRIAYAEFKLRLPELLLMRVDKIGMSTSIEPRVPFLDHRLVEFTMNLTQDLKVGRGSAKALLKEAVRGLVPDAVIDRPKMGFGAPMAQWLRGDFGRVDEAELGASRCLRLLPGPPRGRGRHAAAPPRTSVILITHTLGVVREMTDRVYVMYAGNMVEVAATRTLFANPLHPYTQGLMEAVPKLSGGGIAMGIPGRIPNYPSPPSGCRFHPRCPHAMPICRRQKPAFYRIDADHEAACFLYDANVETYKREKTGL